MNVIVNRQNIEASCSQEQLKLLQLFPKVDCDAVLWKYFIYWVKM